MKENQECTSGDYSFFETAGTTKNMEKASIAQNNQLYRNFCDLFSQEIIKLGWGS